MERSDVVARLREIAALLELHGSNKFKARAYERGARALEASKASLDEMVGADRLTELPGIGVALAHQITELVRTGDCCLLQSLRRGLPSGVLELAQISGIGLHALRVLHEELGIGGVADLRDAARAGKLRSATGFGEKKEQKILEAIARYESRPPPAMRLGEGLRLAELLENEIANVPGVGSVRLAGSLRRSAEIVNEIAFVVEAEEPLQAIERILALPRVASVEQRSADRCRFHLADGTRVEITSARPEAMPVTVLHALSSPAHVAKLAALAAAHGLTLGPTALLERGQPLPLREEREIYERLGLRWIPPELREDVGEIELAAAGDPFDLVEPKDLRGVVHCHTTWSDGRGTIEEMALAAEASGAQFITITDHSAAAHYANGLDVERLKRQWDEIAAVQERVQIKILRGTEADILAGGGIDWPDAILEQLDVVIASIHARFKQDESQMTERVLRAMRHPVFKIWGHPMGRMVLSRPPIPLRVEEVLDAIAESRGAIEINGDPHRLDLEPVWARAARSRGIPFVLGVDAHSTRSLDNARYAVGIARRAGIRRGDVLNARSAAAFADAVRPAPSAG